jgi:hypothetical protein
MHAFPAAADGETILPGAGVDHFVVIDATVGTTHCGGADEGVKG